MTDADRRPAQGCGRARDRSAPPPRLSCRFASRLANVLGETGTNVFLRLSAFILLCLSISILWSGIVGLIATLD